ncbi:MAG: M16 family metallopeptidase [Micavibrio sp.]
MYINDMKKLFLIICLTVLIFSPASFAANGKVYNAETFTLENGMQVVVIPNHRAPVVTHMIWYKVGSADEPRNLSGMAHYLEHLLFKGTPTLAPGEFSRRIRAIGGNENAFTSSDYTAFFESFAVDQLESVMQMEADRMMNTSPPEKDFLSERNVVLEERRERTENDPRGFFSEQLRALLFINHPYGIPVIGWQHEVSALTWKEIEPFYKNFYGPNNAIVVVAGDITAEKFKPLAEKIYGPLKPIKVPERRWTSVPPMIASPTLTLHHADIQQPSWMRMYRVPSLLQDKQQGYALGLLEEILSGGAATRFYKSLVVEQKLATSASFNYDGMKISDGVLWLSATPAEGVSLETLEKAVEAEIALLLEKGITEQELAEAKVRLQDSAAFARDSLSGPAMNVGYALAIGLTLDDVEYWPQKIEAITKEEVESTARALLSPASSKQKPYVTGYLLPEVKGEEIATEPAIATPAAQR